MFSEAKRKKIEMITCNTCGFYFLTTLDLKTHQTEPCKMPFNSLVNKHTEGNTNFSSSSQKIDNEVNNSSKANILADADADLYQATTAYESRESEDIESDNESLISQEFSDALKSNHDQSSLPTKLFLIDEFIRKNEQYIGSLQKNYIQHIPISSFNKRFHQTIIPSDEHGITYSISPLVGDNSQNPIKKCKQRLKYMISKLFPEVKEVCIHSGPFLHWNSNKPSMIKLSANVCFRDVECLISGILMDEEYMGLGYLCKEYLPLPPGIISSTYSNSLHFQRCCDYIKKIHPDGITLAFSLWSDSALYMNRGENKSGHAICLTLINVSATQFLSKQYGTRLLGFHNYQVDFSNENNLDATKSSWLRSQLNSKTLFHVLQEFKRLGQEGMIVNGEKYIPYIALVCADFPEHKLNTCTTRCMFCSTYNDHNTTPMQEKGNNFDPLLITDKNIVKDMMEFEEFQTSLSDEFTIEEVRRVQEFEKRMLKYQESCGRKMIFTFMERLRGLNQEPNITSASVAKDRDYILHPVFAPDRLHTLIINETRRAIEQLYKSTEQKKRASFFYQIERAGVDKSFAQLNIPTVSGMEIVTNSLKLLLCLCNCNILNPFKDITTLSNHIKLFMAYTLVVCITSKEIITEKDAEVLDDAGKMISLFSLQTKDRAIFHQLCKHLLDIRLYKLIGSPRFSSTSNGESFIADLKRGQHPKQSWRKDLLEKYQEKDIFIPRTWRSPLIHPSPKALPNYAKAFRVKKEIEIGKFRYMDITYFDKQRNNNYFDSKCLKLCTTPCPFKTRYSMIAIAANKRYVVTEIKSDAINTDTWFYFDDKDVLLKAQELVELSELQVAKYRHDNRINCHTELWNFLTISNEVVEISAVKIIGACYYEELYKDPLILAILNHQYSHILTGSNSISAPDDCRFALS